MEGLLFYWFFWTGWVITTFFYPKDHPDRLKTSAWILGAVILSPISFQIFEVEWNGTGIWILLTAIILCSKLDFKKFLYVFLTTFIIMLATVCFLLFELFDPVWLLIKREWFLAIIVVYLSIMLHEDKRIRILTMMLGMLGGEIFYSYLLLKYSFAYQIAAFSFLDALALSTALMLLWNSLESISAYFNKYLHTEEKEKQKIT